MIDPITALEGLQTAISVVKKASKVASDLAGLPPSVVEYLVVAGGGGGGSSADIYAGRNGGSGIVVIKWS